jgi:hypothetical protein
MKHLVRMVVPALALAAMTAACEGGVTTPLREPQEIRRMPLEPLDPIDLGDGGDGGGGGETGGGETGGGTPTVGPFNPPPRPYLFAPNLPVHLAGPGGTWLSCGQITHAYWGFGNDVTRGTVIYVTGVVVPHSRMNWGIYNQAGQLVKTHLTREAGSNCVVAHEPEGVSTADLAPGYYYLYASYNGLSPVGAGPWESSGGYAFGIPGKYVGALRVR